jgi:peptidoglycan/LPS O-acetylase OafA/YrhL
MTGDLAEPEGEVPDAVAPPRGHPRFPDIDGLRAFSVMAVVLYHADQFASPNGTYPTGGPLTRAFAHLDVGVAVFFAITGFLLYRPFFASAVGDAPRVPVRVFYWRRVLRIVPAYWVALIVLAPIITFAPPFGILNFLFAQIYESADARTGIAPAWSVCVEMSFYLLLPLFAFLLGRFWGGRPRNERRRRELTLLAGLWIASVCLRELVHHFVYDPHAVDPLPTTLAWFCGGMALAVISVDPGEHGRRLAQFVARHPLSPWAAALFLYAAVTALSVQNNEHAGVWMFVAYSAIATLLLAPLVLRHATGSPVDRVMRKRPVVWIGLISYGIYLYHYPLMNWLSERLPLTSTSETLRMLFYALTAAGAAIVCAALSYYVVEKPMLRLKRVRDHPRVQEMLGLAKTS